MGLAGLAYEVNGSVIEKRIILGQGQNTGPIPYWMLGCSGPRMKLRPSVQFRPHEARVDTAEADDYKISAVGARYEIAEKPEMPALRLYLSAAAPAFTVESSQRPDIIYRVEESRGYDYR